MLGLLPRFDTITYRELGERVDALARALTQDGLQVGDRVAALGFNSVDFTTIDIALGRIGAVAVPLQTSAAIAGLQPIVTETEPTAFAASVNHLPDAVELILTSEHKPAKVVVFDYHPEVDDEREAVESARAKLAGRARRVPGRPARARQDATRDTRGRRRRRRAGPVDLHLRQHRRTQGRDVSAAQRRQDVVPVEPATGSAKPPHRSR